MWVSAVWLWLYHGVSQIMWSESLELGRWLMRSYIRTVAWHPSILDVSSGAMIDITGVWCEYQRSDCDCIMVCLRESGLLSLSSSLFSAWAFSAIDISPIGFPKFSRSLQILFWIYERSARVFVRIHLVSSTQVVIDPVFLNDLILSVRRRHLLETY